MPHRHPDFKLGIALVAGSAIAWSFGGTISRFLSTADSWTVVFWRSVFATGFLLAYLIYRQGFAATVQQLRSMGWASYVVALCFAGASTAFIVALAHTSVANILLIQAGVPLIAALLAWLFFKERPSNATWLAIAAVIAGVFIMVSDSVTGKVSPIGDGLALLIATLFAIATVTTRRHAEVQMMPAVTLGVTIAALVSAILAGGYAVSAADMAWLVAFGALNLGAGLAMFTMGARLIPAALAALVGTLEPVLGPVWVWLIHGEVPSDRTIIGGAVVFAALFSHLLLDWLRQRRRLDA